MPQISSRDSELNRTRRGSGQKKRREATVTLYLPAEVRPVFCPSKSLAAPRHPPARCSNLWELLRARGKAGVIARSMGVTSYSGAFTFIMCCSPGARVSLPPSRVHARPHATRKYPPHAGSPHKHSHNNRHTQNHKGKIGNIRAIPRKSPVDTPCVGNRQVVASSAAARHKDAHTHTHTHTHTITYFQK